MINRNRTNGSMRNRNRINKKYDRQEYNKYKQEQNKQKYD